MPIKTLGKTATLLSINNDTALKVINTTISANTDEDSMQRWM